MPELLDALERMTSEQRKGALIALDIVARPLTPREIDQAFRERGLNRTTVRAATSAIKGLHIVAMVPKNG